MIATGGTPAKTLDGLPWPEGDADALHSAAGRARAGRRGAAQAVHHR
jgi:hypothetical protein